ncbi:cupin domain-containing protein [Rhizobium leguminosarum]|uniref:XRE family transcriptional regulator n=1 Tax=Rhizobium leguminosarum TaxID=384 RepID=A0A1B1CK04_RHILE|nr:XRE family transcriptional regulator [Rhizobium leguminosarum]
MKSITIKTASEPNLHAETQLAARSGISHSTISLIERDRMSPSIDTLSAVLEALGTTMPGFFSDLQSTLPYSPFYASVDLAEIGKVDTISYRVIGLDHPNRQLLMLHERYAPGADTGEEFSHAAQEAGMVLSGKVEVTVGDQKRVLQPGDGYYFDSRLPHRFRNVDDRQSEILSAITPPAY